MLSNKGIDKVEAAEFYSKADEEASDGAILKGEHKLDDNGDIIFKKVPFFIKNLVKPYLKLVVLQTSSKNIRSIMIPLRLNTCLIHQGMRLVVVNIRL